MTNLMGQKMGQIMMICLISLMSTRSSALSESRSINDRLKQIDNSEDSKSPIKKAYTYVSEYKRLPVFNFGIGKRWIDTSGAKFQRSLGDLTLPSPCAKLNNGDCARETVPEIDGPKIEPIKGMNCLQVTTEHPFDYPYNTRYGKRWAGSNSFKGGHPYNFGFGKRSDSANLYPLRLDYMPYDNYENYMSDDMPNDPRQKNKRGGRVRQYDFGLGKRMVSHPGSLIMGVNQEENEALRKHLNDNMEQRFLYGLRNRYAEDPEEGQEDD